MIARIVALLVLLPALALGQPKPPLRTLQVNGAAPSPVWPTFNLVGSGVSVSNDSAHKRTNVTFTGGGGGGTGIATSFQVLGAAPGSPASGDVWYDVSLGSFCGRRFVSNDCFATLAYNTFSGDQTLQAFPSSNVVTSQISPALALSSTWWNGSSSANATASLEARSNLSTTLGDPGLRINLSGNNSGHLVYYVDSGTFEHVIGGGDATNTFTIAGYETDIFNRPALRFYAPANFAAGHTIFDWSYIGSSVMTLSQSGGKGVLGGLVSITDLVPAASSNSGLCLQSNGTSWLGGSCGGSNALPPAGVAGRLLGDNGSAAAWINAGTTSQILIGGASPSFGALNLGTMVTGTLADGSLPTTMAGKTLTTPTIASFVNATHNHQSAAGGGALDAAAITTGTFANARLTNPATTVNGQTCTLGSTCTVTVSGITGTLPVGNGGTNSTSALTGNRLLTSNAGATAIVEGNVYDWQIAEVTSSTTNGGGAVDTVIALPAAQGSNGTNGFLITDLAFRVTRAPVGNTINVRCGFSAGGTELLVSTGVTTLGQVVGDAPSELGSACVVGQQYNCYANNAQNVTCRVEAPAGTLSTSLKGIWTITGKRR